MISIAERQLGIRQMLAYGRIGGLHISHPEDPNRECDCFWDMDKNANRATRLNPQSKINTPEDTDVNLDSNGD